MKRRSKDKDKDAPAGEGPGQSSGAPGDGEGAGPEEEGPRDLERLVQDKLAPVEESLQKSDAWMKETSAQLARISSHVQQDEKRQGVLDDRLSGFEERLQSMLQLTEVLSMGENPFVKKGRSSPESADDDEDDDDRHQRPGLHTRNDGVVVVEAGDEDIPTQKRGNGSRRKSSEPDPTERAMEAGSRSPEPEINEEALLALEASNPFLGGGDDDDWDDEPAPASPPPAPAAPTPSDAPGPFSSAPPTGSGDPVRDAEKRLVMLQWATLIAKHMHRLDVDEFLETYLHTGWVSQYDIKNVRALASDLTKHNDGTRGGLGREEIHLRTILLLSRLAGAPHPSNAADATRHLVAETRRVASGDWAGAGDATPEEPPVHKPAPPAPRAEVPSTETAPTEKARSQGSFPAPPVPLDKPIGHARRGTHPNDAAARDDEDDDEEGASDAAAVELDKNRRSYRVKRSDETGGAS